MRSIGAIFLLTLRGLARSRFFLSLLVLALAIVVLLPFVIRDDGTAAGRFQVLLRYTVGAVLFLLSVATLGVAPALVAGELESRRLQQALVKPVHFHQIWFGKWLALAAVNALVLGAALLLAQGLLHFNLRVVRPDAVQLAELERTLLTPRVKLEPAEKGAGPLAPPGTERRWRFEGGPRLDGRRPLTLRVHFMSVYREEKQEMEGEWSLGYPGQPPFFKASPRLRPLAPREIVIPPPPAGPGGPLEAVFVNRGRDTILFHPVEGVRLLVPAGGAAANLFRAYLLMVFKLALLAAIGLTMGSLFSSPVAVLTSFFALALFAFSGYIGSVAETGVFYEEHDHGHDHADVHAEEEGEHDPHAGESALFHALEMAVKAGFRGADRVLGPVRRLDPLDRLAAGERVSPAETGRGLLVLVALGSGGMALVATGLFRRREIG